MAREKATAETRARLLEAASVFMRDNDTLDVSLDQIARTSGLNGALVGYHFGSKTGLLRALLERDAGAALEQLEQLVVADLPPVTKMRYHLQGLIRTYAKVPYLNRLAVLLLKSGDADSAANVSRLVRPVIDAQRRIIEQGIASGDFRPIDPLLFYFAAISACDGIFGGRATLAALFDYDGPVDALRRVHAEQTVTLLLHGLVKAPE